MNLNEQRFTATDVANMAGLDPSTVDDWTRRGLVKVAGDRLYSSLEAARFTAMASLIGHGVAAYRAAETVRRIEGTQGPYWAAALERCANGEVKHVYVYTVYYGDQGFNVFLYAGDSVTADQFILASLRDSTGGELEADDGTKIGCPVSIETAYRTARFDIGPDLNRAMEAK